MNFTTVWIAINVLMALAAVFFYCMLITKRHWGNIEDYWN